MSPRSINTGLPGTVLAIRNTTRVAARAIAAEATIRERMKRNILYSASHVDLRSPLRRRFTRRIVLSLQQPHPDIDRSIHLRSSWQQPLSHVSILEPCRTGQMLFTGASPFGPAHQSSVSQIVPRITPPHCICKICATAMPM